MAATGGASGFADAYAHLRRDPSFQFAFLQPPRQLRPPGWLIALFQALGHALQVASPVVRVGVWFAFAAAALILLALVLRQTGGRRRRGMATPLNLQGLGAGPIEAAARAVARLADADRLAANARYAEAVHLLLLTGVDEVERVRPGRIRPSFTSRDIAALSELPSDPRQAFSHIAGTVERALFGGSRVDAAAWRGCRDAYLALTQPEAWQSSQGAPNAGGA